MLVRSKSLDIFLDSMKGCIYRCACRTCSRRLSVVESESAVASDGSVKL
jgi:hypothetical protein